MEVVHFIRRCWNVSALHCTAETGQHAVYGLSDVRVMVLAILNAMRALNTNRETIKRASLTACAASTRGLFGYKANIDIHSAGAG